MRPILTKPPVGWRAFPGRGPAVTFVRQRPANPHAEVHPRLNQWTRSCLECPQPFRLPEPYGPALPGPVAYQRAVAAAQEAWEPGEVAMYRSTMLLPSGELQRNYGLRVGDLAYAWWGEPGGFGKAYVVDRFRWFGRRRLSAKEFTTIVKMMGTR